MIFVYYVSFNKHIYINYTKLKKILDIKSHTIYVG